MGSVTLLTESYINRDMISKVSRLTFANELNIQKQTLCLWWEGNSSICMLQLLMLI